MVSINRRSVKTMELKGKHLVEELEGVRCTIVESGIPASRKAFLSRLLEHNGFEVRVTQDKDKEGHALESWTLGVTDILFNPVIAIYQQKLFTGEGDIVTPAYWQEHFPEAGIPYWQTKSKE
ncbi:MAG: hypothetical protein JXA23_12460 [Bacteroidales bacterium]|nr:hypothetical protein [Bacteroidales bacterium]